MLFSSSECNVVAFTILYRPPRGRFSHLAMFRLGSLLFIPAYLTVVLYRPLASENNEGGVILMTGEGLPSDVHAFYTDIVSNLSSADTQHVSLSICDGRYLTLMAWFLELYDTAEQHLVILRYQFFSTTVSTLPNRLH